MGNPLHSSSSAPTPTTALAVWERRGMLPSPTFPATAQGFSPFARKQNKRNTTKLQAGSQNITQIAAAFFLPPFLSSCCLPERLERAPPIYQGGGFLCRQCFGDANPPQGSEPPQACSQHLPFNHTAQLAGSWGTLLGSTTLYSKGKTPWFPVNAACNAA